MTIIPVKSGAIVQFAKAPILGQVKTRMQPVLSPEQSLQLHCDLFLHTYRLLASLTHLSFAVGASDIEHPFWTNAGLAKQLLWLQPEGDLGTRMLACFRYFLQQQKRPWAVIVGSDCPFITRSYIDDAIAALEAGERLVLGPATDGGYVLIGMRRPLAVFEGVNWGSDKVLAQTSALAQMLDITPMLLEPQADIDRPEDLRLLAGVAKLQYWSGFWR